MCLRLTDMICEALCTCAFVHVLFFSTHSDLRHRHWSVPHTPSYTTHTCKTFQLCAVRMAVSVSIIQAFTMVRPRSLFIISVLFTSSVCGGKIDATQAQITEDFKESNSRLDASQDPFMDVTLATMPGDARSTLFATCLKAGRELSGKFASIQTEDGDEFVRYVPDTIQLRSAPTWTTLSGDFPSIFECKDAVDGENFNMFKYDGGACMATNSSYSLDDVPLCEADETEAVFIRTGAQGSDPCQLPRFYIGQDDSDISVCALVNEEPMTFDQADAFCLNAYQHSEELSLYVNAFDPLEMNDVIAKLNENGYNTMNLWVGAEDIGDCCDWYGEFYGDDWVAGGRPDEAGSDVPESDYLAGYMSKDDGFKLQPSDKSTLAGALCTTFRIAVIG